MANDRDKRTIADEIFAEVESIKQALAAPLGSGDSWIQLAAPIYTIMSAVRRLESCALRLRH